MPAHDKDELVVEDRDELGIRMADRPAKAEMDLASQHHVEHLLRMPGAHAHPDVRMRGLKRLQDGGQHVRAHGRRRGDEELAGLPRPQVVHSLVPLEHLRDGALGVGEESPPGIRQRHPASSSHEELDPELAFEPL